MTSSSQLTFSYTKRTLHFRMEAGTSRGVLTSRDVYWIKVQAAVKEGCAGWGEAAPLAGLSPDYGPDFEKNLFEILQQASSRSWSLSEESLLQEVKACVPFSFPSIRFGLETALLDYANGGKKRILVNTFYDQGAPLPINGLIWMGSREFMLTQIDQKLQEGFGCLKMKIGAIDFEQELRLLAYIREQARPDQLLLRVDANGAFSSKEALAKLEQLAPLGIHSIEQPIAIGQWDTLQDLCKNSPIPIALDEELIGLEYKEQVLTEVQPQYLILKPSLLGGILETRDWIQLAEERGIGWWMTSALESNIGLNAIAQLTSTYQPSIAQGLGTGKLYYNNLASPLEVAAGEIHYRFDRFWELPDTSEDVH
jgi:o-succinylbenzoate synthase